MNLFASDPKLTKLYDELDTLKQLCKETELDKDDWQACKVARNIIAERVDSLTKVDGIDYSCFDIIFHDGDYEEYHTYVRGINNLLVDVSTMIHGE